MRMEILMAEEKNGKRFIEIPYDQAIMLTGLAKWIGRWGGGEPIGVFISETEIEVEDKRPEPKPRKLILLWQAYLTWWEFMELRKRHKLRALSVLRGKSKMDIGFEAEVLAVSDEICELYRKKMIQEGRDTAGEIWDYLVKIKGLGDSGLTAQLLALIDDIGKFDTVSKLWAYSVGGVNDDGRMTRTKKGDLDEEGNPKKSSVNLDLAALMYNIEDQFVRQRTFPYRDFYDQEKARLRELHPEPVAAVKGENVPKGYPWPKLFTDMHIERMTRRAMGKKFLRDLWIVWRKIEGLPISA